MERRHSSRYSVQRKLPIHAVPKKLFADMLEIGICFEVAGFAFTSGKSNLPKTGSLKFRIQRPDKILLSGCLQHLVDSCLGCIAAKGNVGLAEIQSGKPDDLTIPGHKW